MFNGQENPDNPVWKKVYYIFIFLKVKFLNNENSVFIGISYLKAYIIILNAHLKNKLVNLLAFFYILNVISLLRFWNKVCI
jgi:hypothetical protein